MVTMTILPSSVAAALSKTKSKKSPTRLVKWSEARSFNSSKRALIEIFCPDCRFDDEFDPHQAHAAGADPSTPASVARMGNFYFAQLEEIERFGLTTMYVDFENLQDFT